MVKNVSSLETLLSATITNKQYYPIDFAKLAPFLYISQLKQSNLNGMNHSADLADSGFYRSEAT